MRGAWRDGDRLCRRFSSSGGSCVTQAGSHTAVPRFREVRAQNAGYALIIHLTIILRNNNSVFPRTAWNTENGVVSTSQPLSFTELQLCFLWTVWNTENTVVTTAKPPHLEGNNMILPRTCRDIRNTKLFHFPIVKKGYNPVSRECSETPKTRLSPRSAFVFLQSYNQISHECSETPKTGLLPLSVTVFFYGVTPLFPTDALKHWKRGYNHRETSTF